MNDYEGNFNQFDSMPEVDNLSEQRQFPMGPVPPIGYPPVRPTLSQAPIIEPPVEKVVNRCMVHEVPHVCPINTRIINNHIFRHTYRPLYSCCEQNIVSHVQEGYCSNFY